MRSKFVFSLAALAVIGLAASLMAQQQGQQGQRGDRGRGGPGGGPGGFGGFGGGGGNFTSRLGLLRNDAVRKELELADEQVAEIEKISEELRAKYPMFGGRGGPGGPGGGPGGPGGGDRGGRRGGNNNNNEGAFIAPAATYFVALQEAQQQGQGRGRGGPGGGFQPPTPEQQAEFDKARLERAREEKAKLAEVLLPNQIKRLNEIFVQQAGMAALQDDDIAKELGINDTQKAKLAEVRTANGQAMQEMMRAMFQGGGGGGGGDRDANRAKMDEARKAGEAKVLAVLTADQQKKFEAMKGKPFEMPEGGRGGFGGGRPGGTGGRGGNNNN